MNSPTPERPTSPPVAIVAEQPRRFTFTWPRALFIIAGMTGAAAALEVLARDYPDPKVQVIARTLQVGLVGALGVLSSGLASRRK